jgi:hypothetical protein
MLKNKDKIKKWQHNNYIKNKEIILNRNENWRDKNLEKVKKKNKEWIIKNIDKFRARQRQYLKKRYYNDLNFKIANILRSQVIHALNRYTISGKIYSSKKYGISYNNIIKKLINTLPQDYNQQDYHIDHIRPLSSFNLENSEEVKKAFDSNNLQWLLARDNLSKGNNYNGI